MVQLYKSTGELGILADLYQNYMDLVYAVCFKYLRQRDAAQDAVMEIFGVITQKLMQHEVNNFRSWLFTVARNHCLMQLRRSSKVISVSINDDMQFTQEMHHDEINEKEWQLQQLTRCIEKLSSDQQQSITLFFLEQKCYNEIAMITGLEWNKVRSLIQNGKRNLKICMDQPEETIIVSKKQ